jgi:predicted S18 family serine protease
MYLAFFHQDLSEQILLDQNNHLHQEVSELREQLTLANSTIQSFRAMIANSSSSTVEGYASLQGPAVRQKIDPVTRRTVSEGIMTNISVEIRPGEGRVLVQTRPLMGIVFQDAANTAVLVAQNSTGKQLANRDVIFVVEAQDQIPAVDGPSAGALMTSLVILALTGVEPPQDVALTGTIEPSGHIGAIGGVVEKAQAAREYGKTLILLPRENARLVQYPEVVGDSPGVPFIERMPSVVDAKQYIEKEIGIRVEYVDSIGDIQSYLT